MSNETKAYKRIRAEDVHNAQSWTLPQMGRTTSTQSTALQHKKITEVTVVDEVIAAEKITVAELEAIRETARIEGLAAGLEEGRSQGRDKGHAEGLLAGRELGYKEGFQQGETEVARLQALLQDLLAELQTPLEKSTSAVEDALVKLVVLLAEKTVGVELETRKDLLLASIQEGMQQLPEPITTVLVKVSEDDVEFVRQSLVVPGASLVVESAADMTSGGFRLETENTLIQDEVETRFSNVVEQFYNNLSHEVAGDHE
ncbi:FliH/SctL family protein [Neptuniibacter pectenicola]|uniref:FliH/SctL family protein n=1 Tax=Neptuniibacter pectenicola TaxID=1806669 RepID=UPI0008305688|nr:FliH/SctL family protein [Neptuniibacter pectenicola]